MNRFSLKPLTFFLALCFLSAQNLHAERQMETLDRGLTGIKTGEQTVFLTWRLLTSDPVDTAFHVYRTTNGERTQLTDDPINNVTYFIDDSFDPGVENRYEVSPAGNSNSSKQFLLKVNAPVQPYHSIPLQTPEGYAPNDASVGDLDGDGDYDIVIHQAGRGHDNSHSGFTDPPILEAYTLEGERFWQINLGINIREGAHYTQFMVYDLDGDGHAEVACKTADGTVDGTGEVIGNPEADYRNEDGYILAGPEYLTIFDGKTGAALATTDYVPPRHPDTLTPTSDQLDELWGDGYGNRVDRFLACVAYLDGTRPSLVMCRGYYTRTVLAAWNWRDGELSQVWTFDSHDGPASKRAYAGQGNHSLSVGDIDQDGNDEIVYGAMTIDHDGTGLYTTRLGHGDALHLSDIDPSRPGMEVFNIHENARHEHGIELHDAETGEIIWSKPSSDVGRGLAADIDPTHPGYECWASGPGLDALYNCKGEVISENKPRSCNMAIWWDGDLIRELLDGTRISKWQPENSSTETIVEAQNYNCVRNNGTKSNPCLYADILGDWREEVIWRTEDNQELRVFVSTEPTNYRMTTLMHDPVYRLSVVWQNVAYNQPTQPGFYFGAGMELPRKNASVKEYPSH